MCSYREHCICEDSPLDITQNGITSVRGPKAWQAESVKGV